MQIDFKQRVFDPSVIFSLREISLDAMVAAVRKVESVDGITVVDMYSDGIFESFIVVSGGKTYEVIRFGYFFRCECKDFEFKHGCCKHIYKCLPYHLRREAEHKAMDSAPYLKQTNHGPAEKVGGIRI